MLPKISPEKSQIAPTISPSLAPTTATKKTVTTTPVSSPPLRKNRLLSPINDTSLKNTPSSSTPLSPSLQKKLARANVQARAQRLTPELPTLLPHLSTAQQQLKVQQPQPPSLSNNTTTNPAITNLPLSPSLRRLRVRTLEISPHSETKTVSERLKRNTDSLLSDSLIGKKLKRRLGARRKYVQNTGLKEFLFESITNTENGADVVAAVRPTGERCETMAKLAFRGVMEGFFVGMEEEGDGGDENECYRGVRDLFLESLVRVEYGEGDFVCREGCVGDKLYVVEEGRVEFLVGGIVVGSVSGGSLFGELSLVYGVPHRADARVVTESVIMWTMDALNFRRVQSVAAKENLSKRKGEEGRRVGLSRKGEEGRAGLSRTESLKNFRKQFSSMTDLQETGGRRKKWEATVTFDLSVARKLAILGKGTFGLVSLVSYRDTSTKTIKYYGLKCMSKSSIVTRNNQKRVLIEKNALATLSDSPFIISLYRTYSDTKSIYFLTEFIPGGNLMSYMIKKDILSHSECIFFTANLTAALDHIHKKGFIHRDIKPENCLITHKGYLKICDFGMAKRLPSTVTLPNGGKEVVTLAFTMCGTPEFMAPEFVLSTGYDKAVDWWALGCILVEMYTGRAPFEFDGDLKKTFREVCLIGMGKKKFVPPSTGGVFQKKGMEPAASFVAALLTGVNKRLVLGRDVMRHAYFKDICFGDLEAGKITAPYRPKLSGENDVTYFKQAGKQEEEDGKDDNDFVGDDEWCRDF